MASSREIVSDSKSDDNDEDLESLRLAALLSMKSGSHTYPILKPYRSGQTIIRTQTFNQRKHTLLKRRGLLNQKSHRRSNLIVIQPSSNPSQNSSFAKNILLIEEKKIEEKKGDKKGPSRFSRVNDSSGSDSEMSDICDNSEVPMSDISTLNDCKDVLNAVITNCEKLPFNQKCSAEQFINLEEEEMSNVNTKDICTNFINSDTAGSEENVFEKSQCDEKVTETPEDIQDNASCHSSDELNLTFHVRETLDEFLVSPCSPKVSPDHSNQESDLEEGELADDDLNTSENRSEEFPISKYGNDDRLSLSTYHLYNQKPEKELPDDSLMLYCTSPEIAPYPKQLENSHSQRQSAGLSSSNFDCSSSVVKSTISGCPSSKSFEKHENWQKSELEESYDVQLPKRGIKKQNNSQSDCSSEEYDHEVCARGRETENDTNETYGSDTILADDDLRHSLLKKQMNKKKDFFRCQRHERSRSHSEKSRSQSDKSRSQRSHSDRSRSQHSRSDRSRSQRSQSDRSRSQRSRSQENLLNRKRHRQARLEQRVLKLSKAHRSRSNSTSSMSSSSEEESPKIVSSIVKSVRSPLQSNIKNTESYSSEYRQSRDRRKESVHSREHSPKISSRTRRPSSSSSRRRSHSRTRVPVKYNVSKSRVPSWRHSPPKSRMLSKRHESRSPKPSSRKHLSKSRVSLARKSTSESRILKRSVSPLSDGSRGFKNDGTKQHNVSIHRRLGLKQKLSVSSEASRPIKVFRDTESSSHSSGSQKTSKNRHKKKSKERHSKRDRSSKKKKSHH